MSSILNRNTIMTGYVDSFCLACEAHLWSDEDAILHIAKPIHKRNLDATVYLDKFKEDHVRKVKKGYYCEFCNLFMKTAAKVGPHVAEPKHCENKASLLLKREGNGVLAFDKVLIPENAWHGLIDDTCAVCDAEFDNVQIHKTETGHILNLVLIEIEFAAGNVYRKVDDSTFQCLTCNLVCAQNALTEHFDDAEHKKLYERCCDAVKAKTNESKKETQGVPKDGKPIKDEKEPSKTEKEFPPKQQIAVKAEKETPKTERQLPKEDKPKKKTDVEKPKKTPEIEKKQEIKKGKPTDNGVNKDKLGKTDKDICKTLGADNFVAKDVCGKQWCILCDWAMDEHTVPTHINSKHHQTLLKMHQKRQEENAQKSEPAPDDSNHVDPKAESKSKILDSADEFQKNDIKLDFVVGSAYCRICSKSIDFDDYFIRNHIGEHKKNPAKAATTENVKAFPTGAEKTSSTSLFTSPVRKNDKAKQEKESRASSVASNREVDVEVENLAKQHGLTYNRDNNNAFCRVCLTKVPASIKNMKEHVNGMSHKNKVAKVDVKPSVTTIVKEPSHDFVDSIITIENMFAKDIVINEKYCVNIFSFMMITRTGADARNERKMRCQACEITLPVHMIDEHKKTSRHERTMNDAPVVSSEESEFIREIRPNIFHCGFCNQIESSWRTMESHLKSTAHREAKTAANWRLQEYTPMIMRHKARQQMEFMFFSRMLMAELFGSD